MMFAILCCSSEFYRADCVQIPRNIPVTPVSTERLKSLVGQRGAPGKDLIYRRFKVFGGINLEAFQDKVLHPVMGWYVIFLLRYLP